MKLYDGLTKFHDVKIVHLPWVESMINEKGAMHQAKCKICTFVEGEEKSITPKLDNLLKHVKC
jgi:hypothetical protein